MKNVCMFENDLKTTKGLSFQILKYCETEAISPVVYKVDII